MDDVIGSLQYMCPRRVLSSAPTPRIRSPPCHRAPLRTPRTAHRYHSRSATETTRPASPLRLPAQRTLTDSPQPATDSATARRYDFPRSATTPCAARFADSPANRYDSPQPPVRLPLASTTDSPHRARSTTAPRSGSDSRSRDDSPQLAANSPATPQFPPPR
uniref:Uncharacterized protein n=1 Tax=Knipowitschia caucasica TaxID=637954 RepID=A0AAV2KXG3_KNICA